MNSKKKSIRDQAVTAAGGLAAGAIGALAGPEVAAIAGAVGSVGALLAVHYAPAVFEDTIVHRYLSNRKVCNLLRQKIAADFRFSFLDCQGAYDQAMQSARATVDAANDTDSSIGSFDSRYAGSFRWRLPDSDLTQAAYDAHLQSLASYCKANGPIRIASASICAAPSAIFRDLEQRFSESHGLQFHLYSDEINARDLFTTLRRSSDYDFTIGAIEAYVQCDRDRVLPFRLIGPLFGERQWVFVSTKHRKGFRAGIWVFTRSTADLHYLVGLAVPRSSEKQIIDDARQMPELFENIPPGDMVIAWDPLANLLHKRENYAVVPQSEYMIHFFLMGHRRIFVRRRFPLEAFLGVFLTEWRRFQYNHSSLANHLCRDTRFMRAFALGCGHSWTAEV
jgi:hypothetical protein